MFQGVYDDQADVTPDMVRWARERLGLPIQEAAKRLGIQPALWEAWEADKAQPTMSQAQALADKFYIPLGYLWLEQPPAEQLPLPDLRTITGEPPSKPSPALLDLLNDVMAKQDWYRDYQQREGADPVPFIGRYSVHSGTAAVAAAISATFALNDEMRDEASSSDHFLRLYIRRAEAAGILVLRSGVVEGDNHRTLDVRELRGFAISDTLSPVVFINSRDSKNAQNFTLTHEIAHLFLVQSGVCMPDYRISSAHRGNPIEAFCDRVAAETLVPPSDLLGRWNNSLGIIDNLRILANRYRISRLVILRTAHDMGKIETSLYWSVYNQISKPEHGNIRPSDGGDYYAATVARNSRTLTSALLASLATGGILTIDAAQLLNVRAKTLARIADYLSGDQMDFCLESY